MIRSCQNIIFEKILKIQIQSDEESQQGGKNKVKGEKIKFKRKDRKGFIPTRKMMQKTLKGRTKEQKNSGANLEEKLKRLESLNSTYMKESEIFTLYNEDTANVI